MQNTKLTNGNTYVSSLMILIAIQTPDIFQRTVFVDTHFVYETDTCPHTALPGIFLILRLSAYIDGTL